MLDNRCSQPYNNPIVKIYPLKFKPIFKERIWGGQNLRTHFDKDIPADTNIGESWELADLPEDKSQISNGPLAGKTIDKAIEEFGEKITGKKDYTPPLQLLIKILDAQDILSVQVHPDAETCQRTGKGDPKTECWYIIHAEPDAVIYKGLIPGTTKEQFARAITDGTCDKLLQKIPVKPGQCHFLPSGTAHAIGPGLVIAEIQQPSDTTYRVFDWNRTDPKTGKSRQLHIEDALESIHFDSSRDILSVNTVGRLVDSDIFKVDKGHQVKDCQALLSPGQMKVLIFLTGTGNITAQNHQPTHFQKGDVILIPADYTGTIIFEQDSEYLTVTA
jgi:mannose-6-phosphate isomerase